MGDDAAGCEPRGPPVLHQRWTDLVFLHWPVDVARVQQLLPRGLQVETYDGSAWLGVTPFRVRRMRPSMLPALPWISRTVELNFRTYVRAGGVSGVWFFSLDATNPLAVLGARALFRLPYHLARMTFERSGPGRRFRSERTHAGAGGATFEAEWTLGRAMPAAVAGTLDHFLVERYWLFAADRERLWRSRIRHARWPLRGASVKRFGGTLFEAQGLPAMRDMPIVHAQAHPLDVAVWPLQRVRREAVGDGAAP